MFGVEGIMEQHHCEAGLLHTYTSNWLHPSIHPTCLPNHHPFQPRGYKPWLRQQKLIGWNRNPCLMAGHTNPMFASATAPIASTASGLGPWFFFRAKSFQSIYTKANSCWVLAPKLQRIDTHEFWRNQQISKNSPTFRSFLGSPRIDVQRKRSKHSALASMINWKESSSRSGLRRTCLTSWAISVMAILTLPCFTLPRAHSAGCVDQQQLLRFLLKLWTRRNEVSTSLPHAMGLGALMFQNFFSSALPRWAKQLSMMFFTDTYLVIFGALSLHPKNQQAKEQKPPNSKTRRGKQSDLRSVFVWARRRQPSMFSGRWLNSNVNSA